MAEKIHRGTIDGMPAKIVYHPARRQTYIYWGGRGRPDGPGHNHATVLDSNPDAFHFMRVDGKVVVNHSYSPLKALRQRRKALAPSIGEAIRMGIRWGSGGGFR